MKPLKTNLFLKVTLIVVIGLLLLVPTVMIKGLIREREYTQRDAIAEVSSKWGREQTIAGPIISVPYTKYMKQSSEKGTDEKIVQVKEYIHFLPTELKITGNIIPDRRHRGIYEIVVYNSNVTLSGSFEDVIFSDLDIPIEDIQFDNATVSIGIDDLRGIEKQVTLQWNSDTVLFRPGTPTNEVIESGINAPVALTPGEDASYRFSFNLDLKGSQLLYFVPVGETTDVNMSSTWKNPSFNGAFIPDSRKVSETGFTAHWNILNLNRNFPQRWTGANQNTRSAAFGVDLLLPVDNYQKSMRSIKYAILFIGFTFLSFFFVEVLRNVFIHPIQYILVGIALLVFYTLLLSLSEHLTYNLAFIVAALATLLLIVGYVKAILKSTQLSLFIGGILLLLYTFIFVIIQLQDYALLIGSIGIFIILGLVMYFSRKIDWYNLKMKENNNA